MASGGERRLSGPFSSSGDFFKAVMRAGTPGQQTDPRLFESRAASGLGEDVGSAGGFLVQASLATEIFRAVTGKAQVYPRCRRWPVPMNATGLKVPTVAETSRATGSRLGGLTSYWLGEGDLKTPSKPAFARIELDLKKLAVVVYASDEILQDSTVLGTFLEQAMAEEISFQVDDAVINGTGAGMPQGILQSPALVQVTKEASQPNTTIVFENVAKMFSHLPASSIQNAVWFCNPDVLPQLLGMTINVKTIAGTENVGGSAAFVPSAGASASPYGLLLGRPVVPIEQCPTLGQVGDLLLADCTQYFVINRDLQFASSLAVRFLYDESCFRLVFRLDGASAWKNSVAAFKGGAQISPFVAIAIRA
jgi:HK97 family phage major capsid protein